MRYDVTSSTYGPSGLWSVTTGTTSVISTDGFRYQCGDSRVSMPDVVTRDEMKEYVKSEIQKVIDLYKEKQLENEAENDFLEYVSKNYRVEK